MVLNEDSNQQSSLDWSKVLTLMSNDTEMMLACRAAVVKTLNRKNAAKLTSMAAYMSWPKKIEDTLISTWRTRPGHWPKNGSCILGDDTDTTECRALLLWIKDCPAVNIACPEESSVLSEIWFHRENYPMSKSISKVD